MNCTNPNCECKSGTFANLNPPTKHDAAVMSLLNIEPTIVSHVKFDTWMLDGIEWQQVVALRTDSGKYRVEITWALDRYRVSVWRRVQEPERLTEVRHPLYARTAVETANRLLRKYNRRES
jgi:hypothetical protein